MNEKTEHIWRIDVLRALAILLVYFCHSLPFLTRDDFGLLRILAWGGVSLFFVISGFCIHLSFLKYRAAMTNSGDSDVVRRFAIPFLWRRFWRIYPSYFLALCFFWFLQKEHLPISHFWSHFFLINNFNLATFFSVNVVFWSLAVEWQFYLLYPFFLFFAGKVGMKKAILTAAATSLLLRIAGAFLQNWRGPFNSAIWDFTGILFLDWTLGAWVAEKWMKNERATRFEILSVILIPFFVLSNFSMPAETFSFTLSSLICTGFVSFYLNCKGGPGWPAKLLIPVGACSYSFYLWHQPLIGRIAHYAHLFGFPNSPLANAFLICFGILLLLVGFSWLLYKFVEVPGMRFGKLLWVRTGK